MAIINGANPGSQINLICMIYRVLQRSNARYSADDLVELCRPSNLNNPESETGANRFRTNLNFWMKDSHQLWVENKDGELELVEILPEATPSMIAVAVNSALFRVNIGNIFENVYDTEGLFRALGCMLACDTYTVNSSERFEGSGKIPTMLRMFGECLPTLSKPPNEAERVNIIRYGLFLGYLETWPGDKFVVDPTRLVKSYLPKIFDKVKEITAEEFVAKLSVFLPLMDGGAYRLQIEKEMNSGVPDYSGTARLSKSLSMSLYRLRQLGLIALVSKSDDIGAHIIQLADEDIRFSSVLYLGGSSNP